MSIHVKPASHWEMFTLKHLLHIYFVVRACKQPVYNRWSKRVSLFGIIISMWMCYGAAQAAPGGLDVSFGGSGIVTTSIEMFSRGYGILIQPDGKIITVGDAKLSGNPNRFAVSRHNLDGSLDNTFGSGGKVSTWFYLPAPIYSAEGRAYSVARQSDSKIIVAGYAAGGFALVRYNTDGSIDSTFGTAGIVTSQVGTADTAYSVVVQSDGKIISAGESRSGTQTRMLIVRYNTDGSLDNTFGTSGIVIVPIGNHAAIKSLVVQPDGKIIAAGYAEPVLHQPVFALSRFNSNGDLDATFGSGGIVTESIGGSDDKGSAVVLQADGKIVTAGYSYNGFQNVFAVMRHDPNGIRDATFGTAGVITTAVGSIEDSARGVAIQPDGKIVIAGVSAWQLEYIFSAYGPLYQFALVRYNSDGSLDGSFGMAGKVTTTVSGSKDEEANAVALQTDGKIVVAGTSNGMQALVRYLIDGSADPVSSAQQIPTLSMWAMMLLGILLGGFAMRRIYCQ